MSDPNTPKTDEPAVPEQPHSPRRLLYPGDTQPTILSSRVTPEGNVENLIQAGSRPSRIVMRSGEKK